MRRAEVSRRVPMTPKEIVHQVDPARLIELEGTFTVVDVEDASETTTVTAKGGGMTVTFTFEETAAGYRYEQAGEAGPFDRMETTFSVEPKDEGSLVSMSSAVSLGLPLAALTDRIAAWKRRGELDRALKRLERELR